MNKSITIKNITKDLELTVSEDSYNTVLANLDWGVVEASHSSALNTDTIGETVTATFFLPRDIEITGWLVAETQSNMTARKKVLNKIINPQNIMQLEYNDYVLNVRADNSVKYGTTYLENNEFMCKFMLSFTAYQPLFLLKDGLIQMDIAITPKFVFPLIFIPFTIFGEYPDQSIEHIENKGEVATGFVLKLEATAEVTNPVLLNNDTGEQLKLNYTMLTGDIITISTLSGNKYIQLTQNGETTNLIGSMERGSVMFGLNSGINHFAIEADANASSIKISFEYAPRFLEVQE